MPFTNRYVSGWMLNLQGYRRSLLRRHLARMMHEMEQHLQLTLALLERTPATLDSLLRGLPDAWACSNEGEGTWTCYDVVRHLVHAEHTDWMPRLRMILETGETRVFPAFDREGGSQGEQKCFEELLDEFSQERAKNIAAVRVLDLSEDQMRMRGKHPALGAVTLSQLLATWAVHDMTHLHQIARVLGHQYRDAVGPWEAYLGVLHCSGHSS